MWTTPGNGVVVKGVIVSLTKPDVVRAGVEILDAYGLGDLSMRRLAERLGVKAGGCTGTLLISRACLLR